MVTRKLTALALCCLTLFSSCDKDDSSAQVDQLEKELIAEKGKKVVDIKREGDNLIIVYSNGTTSTVPYTDAMAGNIGGQDGKDGVGIESITYNDETGILTISLSNGEVTEFKINGSGNEWDAVLVGDANGSLFITEALLGSVPIIKAEYDDAFQLIYLESNRAVDMQTRKDFDLTRSFANGALDKYTLKEYALEDRVNYSYEYVEDESYTEEVSFNEFKEYTFKERNADGTYTLYRYNTSRWENNVEKFVYFKVNSTAIVVSSADSEFNNYEIVRKKSDTEFHYYTEAYEWNVENEKAFVLREIITINGQVSAGALESTEVVDVDTDAQGRVTKAYEATGEGGVPSKYVSYEYNAAGLIKSSKTYVKNVQGAWVASGAFETYNYSADNRLISTILTSSDGTTREVQKAVYDENGNPTEIWAWQPAVREYRWGLNPETGERGYMVTVREAGLYKVATIAYDYSFKNFLGNSVTALVPELEGYKVVNAIKRATLPDSYSFGHIEYKDFNEYGYPRRMIMDASGDAGDFENAAHLEVALNYTVKSK